MCRGEVPARELQERQVNTFVTSSNISKNEKSMSKGLMMKQAVKYRATQVDEMWDFRLYLFTRRMQEGKCIVHSSSYGLGRHRYLCEIY